MQPIDETIKHEIDGFEHRFAAWLRLRAEKARLALSERREDYETSHKRTSDELDDVERLIMTTPARTAWMVRLKFEVLEQALIQDDAGRTDRGEVWMVAGIKADLLALGIGEARA